MNWVTLKVVLLCLLLASCTTTTVDDQTADETPILDERKYTLRTEAHIHHVYHKRPEQHMCKAIAQTLVNTNDYHPMHIIETFPSPYGRPLGYDYNYDLSPYENMFKKLNSGKVYGQAHEDYGPRHSYVYKNCMAVDRKVLVDDYMSVMRSCYGASFEVYIEKYGGGFFVEGDNGRDCYALGEQLIKVHLQGYKNSPFNFLITVAHGGQKGEMIAAYDRCINAGKTFDMQYDKQHDILRFSCESG